MNLLMDPLGDRLTTRPIQTGWGFPMEPYPSGQFGFIDDPDRQFRNGSVWTRTRTQSDGPEPLLTRPLTQLRVPIRHVITVIRCHSNPIRQVTPNQASHTQSGKSYPGLHISAWILHIVLILIPHRSLSHPQLYNHRRTHS
jgi:hypothetical protein